MMKKSIRKTLLSISMTLLLIAGVSLSDGLLSAAMACNYYASPNGGGNGTSPSSPFRISQFWSVARPGTTLCLLDGEYTGSSSMIKPPRNLRGTSSAPIIIKALNDGKVLINARREGTLQPVSLYYNDWFVIEGINACCGNGGVVELNYSNHNVIRRVAGWDGSDGATGEQGGIFGVHFGEYNLLEDVAGWGFARKIFGNSQAGNHTTIRRAWGRWDGYHGVGPKMTYTLAYNSYNAVYENVIGTWSGESLKETYQLACRSTDAANYAPCGKTFTNYSVDQPNSIFGTDGFRGGRDNNARSKLLGSIAYVQAKDRFHPGQPVLLHRMQSVELANTVVYIEPGSHTNKKTYNLGSLTGAGEPGQNLIARNLTSIGGAGAFFHSGWQGTNRAQGATVDSVPNIFNGPGSGARVCHRYKDGVLTNEPLWPWPMNQRILEATTKSGHTPVNVTATIEKLFGSIPAACKGGSSGTGSNSSSPAATPPPSAPSNLQATP
jgi:hypothetical protein